SVGIFIDPPTADVVVGKTLQLKASPQNTSSGIMWSVDGGSSFGTIDTNGLYTAPAIVPSTGMAVVRAKLMSDNQIQETVEITVLEPTP
ncbi:MAG: hypothetical protein JNK65_06545, partial [Deltaproteobacteria bacterium]|nr:hypothetical protein [Deltaproteobacteria bacterium]